MQSTPEITDLEKVRQRLFGAWSLSAWTIDSGPGEALRQPFGAGATGLLIYSADDWMNASIAGAGRAALSAASVRRASADEQCAAFASYFNYAGRFSLSVIDGHPHITHAVHFSLNPGFVGSRQTRRINFDEAGRLTLSAFESTDGRGRHHQLEWCRASSAV